MSDELTRIALRLAHDPPARQARLGEVLGDHLNLNRHGFDQPDPKMEEWQQDALRRALLWLAVCEPCSRPDPERGSYVYKHRAEKMTGGYVSSGDLICAALMCGLRVFPYPDSMHAKIGLRAPVLAPDGHLMACETPECDGTCVLHNSWALIRSYRHPTLRELVGRAGYFWDELPLRIQRDLNTEYEADPYIPIENKIVTLRCQLSEIAPEGAHEAWGWCSECEERHTYLCESEPLR